MTVILFCVSIYNAGVGILWGKEARNRAIALHVNAMADKDEKTGEKLARPFLHPRLTGLEAGNSQYGNGGEYDAPRAGSTDYNTAYPTNGYTSDGNHPPPVSSLYLPTPTSPSQQDQAIQAPFASATRESGSISDRTVVADPQSEAPYNTSSSSLGGHKKGVKGFFSRNKA